MKIISKSLSIVVATLLCLLCCVWTSEKSNNSELHSMAYSFDLYADNVAALVNEYRTANGLNPLRVIPLLQSDAQTRAVEISSDFSHTRPDGSSYETVFSSSLVKNSWAENIAYGSSTPEEVMEQWKNSSGHNENILNSDMTHIGVGAYISNGTIYWVQLFISSKLSYDDEYMPSYDNTDKSTQTAVGTNTFTELSQGTGDVNYDGSIDSKDAVKILIDYASYLIGNPYTIPFSVGDTNSDGKIDSNDAVIILRYYAHSLIS